MTEQPNDRLLELVDLLKRVGPVLHVIDGLANGQPFDFYNQDDLEAAQEWLENFIVMLMASPEDDDGLLTDEQWMEAGNELEERFYDQLHGLDERIVFYLTGYDVESNTYM